LYLKKIELYGFKSFANKTTLSFEPGVAAIVGPNGCGKSNISDSIKWVLGEQSAKELRGSKMEDIIFNGTDNTEAVNLAEVSLTFSNIDRALPVDYDEVIIARRVFRSGESEYLLNKTQVRLKDITALLAGTGIGVSSYSIAEQGKIDRVLHAKPEDRREIFEEASGITKYKAKRKEALNKLEHTESNLVRIADIVNEVRRQINSIERQAQKAEKFRGQFDALKNLDIKLTLHEYNGLREQEKDKKDCTGSFKQKEGHLSLELNLAQDELRIYREKINSFDENITQTRERISQFLAAIGVNENSIRVDTERIEELKTRSGSLTREIEEIGRRTSEMRQKITSVEYEFNLINDEREKKQALVAETEEGLNNITQIIKQCEKALSDSKVTVMENASNQSKARNELSKVSAGVAAALSRNRRLSVEKDKIIRDKDAFEASLQVAETAFVEQRKVLENILQLLHSLKNTFTQLGINFKEKRDIIDKMKQKLASSSSKLEVLRDLKRNQEGFSEGVKAYMEFIENDPQQKELFVGIVADMIEAKESLIRPLESVLGEKSQAIVVRNSTARQKALTFLKKNKKGRAQFIVSEDIPDVLGKDNFSCPVPEAVKLSELIGARDECKDTLNYLLKETYLVKHIPDDTQDVSSSMVFVTKEGDMKGGIIYSGGPNFADEYTSIIGRDAKIRELANEVDILKSRISGYEQEHSSMAFRLEQLKKDVAGQEEAAKRQEIKLHEKESEKIKVREQKDKLQEELDLIELELDEMAAEEAGLKQREESLNIESADLEAEQNKIEAFISQNQETIVQQADEKEKAVVSLAELRTQMLLVAENYDSQNASLNMLKESLRNEDVSVSERKNQLEEAHTKSSSLAADIERAAKENIALREKLASVNEELTKLQGDRKGAYIQVDEMEKKTRNMQKDLDEIRSDISNFHLNISELTYKANSIKERIELAYKADLDKEQVVFEGTEDFQQIAQEVASIRAKIDKMGHVNLVAIEEHKELQERYDFLSSQQEDLLSAKESLHKAINKINRTTRKMFTETFEQIQVAFKEYFKLLFGGGAAELFLMDQADILESGIEIAVRPPGKKLQCISLLSGGEKALTSVALLFALFRVRSTPFCILDEIDAPLDEANIDRFSRILQEFIKTTQFIIITHNKKTISVCDLMYGITMEKSGISKIVSVQLVDDEKIADRKKESEEAATKKLNQDVTGAVTAEVSEEHVTDGKV
jgi:chromosome segregation protein